MLYLAQDGLGSHTAAGISSGGSGKAVRKWDKWAVGRGECTGVPRLAAGGGQFSKTGTMFKSCVEGRMVEISTFPATTVTTTGIESLFYLFLRSSNAAGAGGFGTHTSGGAFHKEIYRLAEGLAPRIKQAVCRWVSESVYIRFQPA